MRREHVAEIGSRGRAKPRGAGSLALRAGLRLVGHYRGPPSPHVFCRMADPGSHDPRWTAACPVWHRSPCSHCCRGSGPSDRGDSGKFDCPWLARLSALWPVQFTYAEIAEVLSRVLKKEVQ